MSEFQEENFHRAEQTWGERGSRGQRRQGAVCPEDTQAGAVFPAAC